MSAALKLEIFHNGELLREVPLNENEVWVGRDDDCVIRLEDRAISRKHALLRSTPQGIEFEKKSKFGQVRVNGKESEQTMLHGGDRLEMGPYEIRVSDANPKLMSAETIAADPEPFQDSLKANQSALNSIANEAASMEVNHSPPEGVESIGLEQPVVDFEAQAGSASSKDEHSASFDFAKVDNDGATRVFSGQKNSMKPVLQFGDGLANVTQYELTESEIAIGRSQKCNVVLEDRKASRKHSIIRKSGTKFFVKDLGSANGTLVNGQRVDEQELQSGDVLTIGDTEFTFRFVQTDYEQKKEEFIPVPEAEMKQAPNPMASFSTMGAEAFQSQQMPSYDFAASSSHKNGEIPAPAFEAPKEIKKSFIGKFLDRYRAMNTKQQIIYGLVILAVMYMIMDEEPEQKKVKLNTGNSQAKTTKKKTEEKKPGSGMSFETLTPEQQSYISAQYQIAFDLYKNREYDNSLLEVGKIFSLVQDYKNAREIEAFAREGKRKLEAQEEERKKKEQEKLAQIRLQSLIEQAGLAMENGRYREAEGLFPDIEVLQPENTTVSEWRKKIVAENEKNELAQAKRKQITELNRAAWADYQKAMVLVKEKNYWDALDSFDELLTRPIQDQKLILSVKTEIKKSENAIAVERDPLLAQGKQLEQENKFAEAYRFYQKAFEVDPTDTEAPEGMKRIHASLTGRAKSIYAEGVFAESYGDIETAEKQYRQVLEVVPNDDNYFVKAQSRLKKLTVLRKPASGDTVQ